MLNTLTCLMLLSTRIAIGAEPAQDETPKFVGEWSWSWKDANGVAQRQVLKISESPSKKLTAEEVFNDETPVKVDNLVIKDKSISFEVTRGKKTARYKGTYKGPKAIDGLVYVTVEGEANEYAWTAKRVVKDDEN